MTQEIPDLERLARQLGREAAERLDVERVARQVAARLAAEPQPARPTPGTVRLWWRSPAWLRLAAALGLLIAGGLVVRARWPGGAPPAAALANAPLLADLSADELAQVYDSLAAEAPVHETVAVGLERLDEAQLRQLLRWLEG